MDAAIAGPETAADPAALFEAARSQRLPLAALMERAQALHAGGAGETAAKLYETWIAHNASPALHAACFKWGTVLSGLGKHDEAEAAYRKALAILPGFPPAPLNLGHL